MQMNNLRHVAKKLALATPGIGPGIIHAYRKVSLFKRIIKAKINARGTSLPDPETVYWINPERIDLHTNFTGRGDHADPADNVFDPVKDKGSVYGGQWDATPFRFHDLTIFQSLEDVILRNRPWHETDFYKTLATDIGKRRNPWNINNLEALNDRCAYLDRLIAGIRANGYLRAHESKLDGEQDSLKKHEIYGSEISVNIGRNGHYLFQDGRHRLAIAQILKLDKVPVKVLVRHKEWVEFRSYLLSLASGGGGAGRHSKLYQVPSHPDLQDIPAAHGCLDRWTAISENIDGEGGEALDIGANLGYFCHRLEDLGFRCTAVEYLHQIAAAAERIRDAESKSFKVIPMDLFAATEKYRLSSIKFDVVLALNIFHHFLKTVEAYEKFKSWLHTLQVSQMFFEAHCSDEQQMQNAFRNYEESDFVKFILANSQLNYSALIHRCSDGRAIYKLWH